MITNEKITLVINNAIQGFELGTQEYMCNAIEFECFRIKENPEEYLEHIIPKLFEIAKRDYASDFLFSVESERYINKKGLVNNPWFLFTKKEIRVKILNKYLEIIKNNNYESK